MCPFQLRHTGRSDLGRLAAAILGAALLGLLAAPAAARRPPKQGLWGVPLQRDLKALVRAPDGRDCTVPSFRKTVDWVVGRLEAQGVEPLGTGRRGTGRYLQAYRWDALKKKDLTGYNIIGVRPGSGDHREAVVVMAHLDGITAREKEGEGIKRYQGANDNASGVAAVLQVSETLARLEGFFGKRHKRDVLFVFTSGEEAGLVGAEAFARFSKHLGGRKIVGVVNFDSVGWGTLDDVKVYGGSTARAAQANPVYRAAMRVEPQGKMARPTAGHAAGKNYFASSDQHALASGGVPSVLYAAQISDALHTSRDTLGRLDTDTIYGTARHGLRTVLRMANHRSKQLPGQTLPLQLKDYVPWGPLQPARVDRAAAR